MTARVILVLALCAAPADAGVDPEAAAVLHYELTALHGNGPFQDLALAGARLHGFVGAHHVAYHVGLDLAGGATIGSAGFAYDVALFPLGLALRFGDSQMIGVGMGVGAMGGVGTLDDAATMPVEAWAELGLGDRVRVLARARASWVAGADGRRMGARIGDEDEAMLGVRIGHAYHDAEFPTGNGYFVGAAAREMLGAHYLGIVIGYSIDMATPHRTRTREMCTYCD